MRRHAKASTAGSSKTKRAALPIGAFTAILAALALVAALADAAVPTASTGSASEIQKTTATLNGTINPEGALLEECKFEWGTSESYGEEQACDLTPAEIGEGTARVAVKAEISGLSVGTTYHFRLVAKNAEGTSSGFDETFKTLSPPAVEAWSSSVVYSEATLNAAIDPEGLATTYKFQWGPTAAYGSETAEASAGEDTAVHKFAHALSGLAEGATYHYRVVATNANGTTQTPDHTFTTYAHEALNTECPNQVYRYGFGASLPDCRAYEMITPVDKNGADAEPFHTDEVVEVGPSSQAAADGNGVTFSSTTAFADAVSSPIVVQYLSRRSSDGWSTHAISAPRVGEGLGNITQEDVSAFRLFSPDLSTAWMLHFTKPLTAGVPEDEAGLYRANNDYHTYVPLTIGEPTTTLPWLPEFQGASSDGSHAIFTLNDRIVPEALGGAQTQLYEWFDGSLRLVSVLPNGEPSAVAATAGSNGGASIPEVNHTLTHAISEDGSTIFWSAGSSEGGGVLYARIDGTTTIPVSESVTTAASRFWLASADGSRAIFQVESGPLAGNLYEFDVASETATLIAQNTSGVIGASSDLSYLYFVSREGLTVGATAGEPNLYVRHGSSISLIAVLSSKDADGTAVGPVRKMPGIRTAALSGAGADLAFTSDRSLTGYDNVETTSGEPATEVYRYDAPADQLTCVSCNPAGARPQGSVKVANTSTSWVWVGSWVSPSQTQLYQRRVISQDGSRVFFNTHDALLPHDTNGATDVYQWEAPESGDCHQARGCLSLISSGRSPTGALFVDASRTGDDVVFATRAGIDPRDPGSVDLYDARVNGGQVLPPGPPACVGDACQSPPAPPVTATLASAAFHGAGNITAKRARKCSSSAARKLRRRASRLRRTARRRGSGENAAKLRSRAGRQERRAHALALRAKRCRKRQRGAGR